MSERAILLVEDNPDDEALTTRALKKANIKNPIVVARDGAEALEILFGSENQSNPDVLSRIQIVLLDLKLPKVDGLEVLRRIREGEQTRFLPVAVLTSSREEVDVLESYGRGANSYICKPVEMQNFMEAVQQLGLYWLLLNEAPK